MYDMYYCEYYTGVSAMPLYNAMAYLISEVSSVLLFKDLSSVLLFKD